MSKEQLEHFTVEKLSASSAIPLQSGQRTFTCESCRQKYNKVVRIRARSGNRFISQDVGILCVDSTLKPVLKRQMLLIGASLGAGLFVTWLTGNVLLGLGVNIAIMLGLIFYIRRKQLGALRTLGFGDSAGGYGGTKLKYVCLSCGAEVKGARCGSCGSNMKKPLF